MEEFEMNNQDQNLEKQLMELGKEEKKLKEELNTLNWEFDQFSSLQEMLSDSEFSSTSILFGETFKAPRTQILASRIDEIYKNQQTDSTEQTEKYLNTFFGQLTAEQALVSKRLLHVQAEKEQIQNQSINPR